MEIPIKPEITSNIEDHSLTDDSIKQDGGITINASGRATIMSNSGNGRAQKHISGWLQVMAVSIICDILICGILMFANIHFSDVQESRADARHSEVQAQIQKISEDTAKSISDMKNDVDKVVKDSKEGTIWILRRDILSSIELHEQTKTITAKEYKRIKDQFNYYHSIGGNHDVEGRFEDFTTKIMGTNEIQMTK